MGRSCIGSSRMMVMPMSLSDENIEFIETQAEGKNTSAKLRAILDDAKRRSNNLASYSKVDLEAGEFTPTYMAEDAFIVYYKTADGYGWGEDLPFPVPQKSKSITELRNWVAEQGYVVQLIEEPTCDFTVLWAAKRFNKCEECKRKIRTDLEEVVRGLLGK